jgi:Protein of unknown function (DUF4239)
MTILSYGLVTFVIIFGCGLLAGKIMPDRYQDSSTKAVVQTATGLVSLLAALVLGLLVATAKNKFDTFNKQTEEFAAGLMLINRELTDYGPAAAESTELLRQFAAAKIAETWGGTETGGLKSGEPSLQLLEGLQQDVRDLKPQSESQRSAATSASALITELRKTTWLQRAQETDHVQNPFVFVLLGWFAILFFSIGLFAPRNRLVLASLVVGALSIAGAVVIIADMDMPFEGILTVSPDPMRDALAHISAP